MKQGFKLSPYLSILYTESVIREAEIDEMGIKTGGKLVCNLCAESQEEAERLIVKVNNIRQARQLKLNVKKTKLLKIGKIQFYA